MNVKPIKPEYNDPDLVAQQELREDAIYLFTANMTARFYEFNNRLMRHEEIDYFSELFRDLLRKQNNKLKDQTS